MLPKVMPHYTCSVNPFGRSVGVYSLNHKAQTLEESSFFQATLGSEKKISRERKELAPWNSDRYLTGHVYPQSGPCILRLSLIPLWMETLEFDLVNCSRSCLTEFCQDLSDPNFSSPGSLLLGTPVTYVLVFYAKCPPSPKGTAEGLVIYIWHSPWDPSKLIFPASETQLRLTCGFPCLGLQNCPFRVVYQKVDLHFVLVFPHCLFQSGSWPQGILTMQQTARSPQPCPCLYEGPCIVHKVQ